MSTMIIKRWHHEHSRLRPHKVRRSWYTWRRPTTVVLYFNPFPAPGIQSVRPSGSSGRGERPRGPPDPPDGSPGPGEQKEGGHQQTRLPIRPSCLSGLDGGCPASRHAQTVNHGTTLSNPAASLATVSFHKVEHL